MTDLTYCYRHMTQADFDALDTIETADFDYGNLSDEELQIPAQMIPPNPDESDTLPSQVHPSYPYGDPTRLTHPASFPRFANDIEPPSLYEDIFASGVNANLRWRELALDALLPIDQERADAERAAQARKLASGSSQNPPQARNAPPQGPPPLPQNAGIDEDDFDDDDDDENQNEENENDENTISFRDGEDEELALDDETFDQYITFPDD